MKKYSHAFDIAFEVITDKENPDKVTTEELLTALQERLERLQEEDDSNILEAFSNYDSTDLEEA